MPPASVPDTSLPPPSPLLTPASALAWSEAAVDGWTGQRGPCIGLWRPRGVTVAIGIGQTPEVEADAGAMRRDGVSLLRRQSGGGAVLLYDGVLCWEAWAGFEELEKRQHDGSGIRQTYRALCRPVIEGLSSVGLNVFHAGICDISYRDGNASPQKIAGSAQLRRRDRALVHGSLLVCPDLELLEKYLRQPSDQPEYRQNRTHEEFCTSVARLLEWRGGGEELIGMVAQKIAGAARNDGWQICAVGSEAPGDGKIKERADTLEQEKYCLHEWNWEKKRLLR